MCDYHRNLAVKRESDIDMGALDRAETARPELRVVVERTGALQKGNSEALNAVLGAVESESSLGDLAEFIKGEKSLPRGKKGADKRERAIFLRDYLTLANNVLGLSLPNSVTNKNKAEIRLALFEVLQSKGFSVDDALKHIPRSLRG